MLFKDNFYTITAHSPSESGHSFGIELNAAHSIFEGHFPNNPVTPGVVQMEIVKELLCEATGRNLALKKMGNCKFLAILNPATDAGVNIDLKITEGEDNEIKASAVIKNDNAVYLKMSASYFPQ